MDRLSPLVPRMALADRVVAGCLLDLVPIDYPIGVGIVIDDDILGGLDGFEKWPAMRGLADLLSVAIVFDGEGHAAILATEHKKSPPDQAGERPVRIY